MAARLFPAHAPSSPRLPSGRGRAVRRGADGCVEQRDLTVVPDGKGARSYTAGSSALSSNSPLSAQGTQAAVPQRSLLA